MSLSLSLSLASDADAFLNFNCSWLAAWPEKELTEWANSSVFARVNRREHQDELACTLAIVKIHVIIGKHSIE